MPKKPTLDKLLTVLADKDTIRIFRQASTGFKSGGDAPKKLGLTKKQFYTRLSRLLHVDLIAKKNGVYVQTSLGSLVDDAQLKPLERALANYWNLLAIDELKRSKSIPQEEQERIALSILDETGLKGRFTKGYDQPCKVIDTYDDLVQETIRLIDLANQEIFIASRYYEPSVSRRLLEKAVEGVSLNILDSNPSGTSVASRLQTALNDPAVRSQALAILESPRVRIGNRSLDYSFIVVDGEFCGFEVADPSNPEEFNFAVEFRDRALSRKMGSLFERLWSSAEIPAIHDTSTTKRAKASL